MPKKIVNVFYLILAGVIVYNLINQITTTLRSGDRLNVAIDQLNKLEVKNRQLQEQLNTVKSPDFIEKQARDKLGLVKEGETLVIIPDNKLQAVLGVSNQILEPKLPNWQGWLRLFWK